MKAILTCFVLVLVMSLSAQPTQLGLRVDEVGATDIQWFTYDEDLMTFVAIVGETAEEISVTEDGIYYATYTANNCDKSTIPALVACAIGDMTIETVTLNASSPTAGSTYQWILEGVPIPDSTNSSISVREFGRYGVIVDKPGCPLDTQLFDIVGLTCMDTTFVIEIVDPCSCEDDRNYARNGMFFFHDAIRVMADTGLIIRLDTTVSRNIYDDSGMPITDQLMLTEVSPGVYELSVWVKRGEEFTIGVFASNGLQTSLVSRCDGNCFMGGVNCIANLNVSCGQLIVLQDVLVSYVEGFEDLFELSIVDQFGSPLSNPLPPDFVGSFTVIVTNTQSGESCMTLGTVSDKQVCAVRHLLDTTIWCVDDLLSIDPDGPYYRDTLHLRPYGVASCSADTFDVSYVGEWVENFDCGDTLAHIVREWRAETKEGVACVGYDTIVVIRLPEIDDYLYAPQKDTVLCELDTNYVYSFNKEFPAWKQIVNLHSDGTEVSYPLRHSLHTDIEEVYQAWVQITDKQLRDSLRFAYHQCPVLIRWNEEELRYDSFSVLQMYENTNSLFEQKTIAGQQYIALEVKKGDRLMTNGGAYLVVDENWFFEAGEHGFWVDLSYPNVTYEVEADVCDRWGPSSGADEFCHGIELILPDHPYSPDSCKVFCLNDLAASNLCLDVVHIEEVELAGSCPRVVKRQSTVKQSCIADGANLATLADVMTACPRMADNSGLVRNDMQGSNRHLEVEQWMTYLDTIGPILVEKDEPRELVFQTNEHDCYGEVDLPSIEVKDMCSGLKSVKATVGVDNQWVTFNDLDNDRVWEMDEDIRKIELACGDNSIVHYEIMDSCHNVSNIYRHWVSVEDRMNPVVLTPDTLTLSLGGKHVWLDGDVLNKGHSDNCGVARVLVRRSNWLESCGVDACPSADLRIDFERITSKAELDNFVSKHGYFSGLDDNEVERYYAEQYNWMSNDEGWCPLTEKEKQAGLQSFRDLLIASWQQDIINYWIEQCDVSDEHANSLLSNDDNHSLGGGWGDKVPICCDDVCDDVIVEVLVIDKNCNYSKGWSVIRVEDNSAITLAQEFEELEIGCSVFQSEYAELVEAARIGGEAAHDALDEAFGSLIRGWKSDVGVLVDSRGEPLDLTTTYLTTQCRVEVVERKVLDTTHDGEVVWEVINEGQTAVEEVEKEAALGGVFMQCGADYDRSIWVELNDCGLGKITRRWDCRPCSAGADVRGTSEGDNREADIHGNSLIIDQVIWVQSDCELSNYSLNLPNDTLVCSDLTYTLDGNVDVNGGEVTYALGDLHCRQLAISYDDEVFNILGESTLLKIHRTWKVSDWCQNETIEYVQKIILDTDCELPPNFIQGAVTLRDEQTGMSDVRIMAEESHLQVLSDQHGRYRIDYAQAISLAYESDPQEGVDVRDILMVQRHLSSLYQLNTFEQKAADVNADGLIDVKDVLTIRQLLLGTISRFPGGLSWEFYHKPSLQRVYHRQTTVGPEQADFTAVKIGDVDNRGLNLARDGSKVTLRTKNVKLAPGEEVEVVFVSESAVEAFQLNLGYEESKLSVVGVSGEEDNELGWRELELSAQSRAVRVISTGAVLKLRVQSKEGGMLSDLIRLMDDSELAAIESRAGEQVLNNLAVVKKNGFVESSVDNEDDVRLELDWTEEEEVGEFALYQNRPNPFVDQTSISFYLPEPAMAKLTLFDASGQVIYQFEKEYQAGLNSELIQTYNLDGLDENVGVIYYQLETESHSATRQMLRLK